MATVGGVRVTGSDARGVIPQDQLADVALSEAQQSEGGSVPSGARTDTSHVHLSGTRGSIEARGP